MMYVKNKQTGSVEEVDDSSLPEIVNSGQYQLEDRDYEFEDDLGERRLVKGNEIKGALDLGYKYVTDSEKRIEGLKEKYGERPLTAALLGTAKGLTLGISPLILEGMGAFTKDEIEGIEIANPGVSLASEVISSAAPIALSGGSGLVGKVASRLPTAILSKTAEKVGTRAAANITSEIAKKAVSLGVEGAIEGAVLGGIPALTEEALGDKEFNAESVLYKASMGALTGGALGAGIGAGSAAISKATRGAQNKILNTMVDQMDVDPSLKKEALDSFKNQAAIDEGIIALKDPEIQRIKQKYGAPTTAGMESAWKPVKQIEDYLFDSPDKSGAEIREGAKKVQEFVETQVDSIFSGAKEASKEESGDLIRQALFTKINVPLESGKAAYSDIMGELGNSPASLKLRTQVANKIKSSDAFRINKSDKMVNDILGILEDSEDLTLNQIKSLQSKVGSAAKLPDKDREVRKLLNSMYDDLRMLQDNAIRTTLKETKDPGAAKKVIGMLDAANADYVKAYKAKEEIADAFGVKGSSFEDVMEKIEKMSATDLDKRFMSTAKSDKARQMMEKYPDLGKLVLANRQAAVIKKHMLQDGTINYSGLKKTFQKMDKDERDLYFMGEKDAYNKFMDMVTLYEKRPKTLNPSGTDVRKEIREFLSPKAHLDKWALRQIHQGSDSYVGKMVNKVLPNLAGIEKSSNAVKDSVVKAVNGFSRSLSPAITVAALSAPSEERFNKTEKKYKQMMEDPDSYIKDYMEKNRDLFVAAPQTAQALQSKVVAASKFLQSKLPQTNDGFIGGDRQPSKMELTKFADYVDAVEKPQIVLNNIKNGYISPAQIETLRVVYPKIYQALQAEMMNRMPKNLSRTQRSQMQLLLGAKVTPSMSQQGFAILQGQQQKQPQIEKMQQSTIKPTVTGLKDMNNAGRTASSLDTILNRRT
jgi:hypothetical protein